MPMNLIKELDKELHMKSIDFEALDVKSYMYYTTRHIIRYKLLKNKIVQFNIIDNILNDINNDTDELLLKPDITIQMITHR